MTLECSNCSKSMEPSKTLPGDEGAIIYPNLISFIFSGKKQVKIYTESKQNRSLCFECIEKNLKDTDLKKVYDCFESEMAYYEFNESFKNNWMSSSEFGVKTDYMNKFHDKYKNLEEKCIFCSNDVHNGMPYYTGRVVDRIKTVKNFSGTYSFMSLDIGSTYFNICFDDFKKNFPKVMEMINKDLLEDRIEEKKVKTPLVVRKR